MSDQEVFRSLEAGMKRLKIRGGMGDENVAFVDGGVMTVKENVAVAIAKDMIDDAERRYKKKLSALTLIQLSEGVSERVKGRACSEREVRAELARLQNQAIYGNQVPRR